MMGKAHPPVDPSTISTGDLMTGNWRLVDFSIARDGAMEHPLGQAPSGSLCYDRDGRMAVHLWRNLDSTADATMPDYTSYCGRYTFDSVAGTVVHHIEAASIPQLAGSEQVRHVRLEGNHLKLSAQSAGGETRLEWLRADNTDADIDLPPAGFARLESTCVFPKRAGRFYVRDREGRNPVVGTRIGIDQSNSEGYAHGAFLLAFADFAITTVVRGITLNLSADFIRPVRIGEWVESCIVTRKRSANLIFVDTVATSNGRDVLRISGLFKPFGKPE